MREIERNIVSAVLVSIEYVVDLPLPSSEIQTSLDDDLAEARWFDRAELPTIRLTPPTTQLFTELGWL